MLEVRSMNAEMNVLWNMNRISTMFENSVYWPYTISMSVYTIIFISKTGNPTRLFHKYDYSNCVSTIGPLWQNNKFFIKPV